MAGAKCTICSDARRGDAEKAIAGGKSVRAVAKELGLPYASLDRHQRNCVQKAIAKVRERLERKHGEELAKVSDAVAERELKLATDLVGRVERLQTLTDQIISDALTGVPLLRSDGSTVTDEEGKPLLRPSHGLALKAIAQARKNLELIGRLTGTLDPEAQKDTHLITFETFEMLYRRVRLGVQK